MKEMILTNLFIIMFYVIMLIFIAMDLLFNLKVWNEGDLVWGIMYFLLRVAMGVGRILEFGFYGFFRAVLEFRELEFLIFLTLVLD
jgi:hypothetical protein